MMTPTVSPCWAVNGEKKMVIDKHPPFADIRRALQALEGRRRQMGERAATLGDGLGDLYGDQELADQQSIDRIRAWLAED